MSESLSESSLRTPQRRNTYKSPSKNDISYNATLKSHELSDTSLPPRTDRREQPSTRPLTPRSKRESSAESSLFDDTPPSRKRGATKADKGKAGRAAAAKKRKCADEMEEKAGGSKEGQALKKAKPSTSMRSASSSLADELKRLKGYVVACGRRKQWKKIFESHDIAGEDDRDLKSQCGAVRRILGDLGMNGRLSMEKAKKIRAEREFAEELEAVQEGSAKWSEEKPSGQSSRSRWKRGGEKIATDDEADKNDSDRETRKFSNSLADFADGLNSSEDE